MIFDFPIGGVPLTALIVPILVVAAVWSIAVWALHQGSGNIVVLDRTVPDWSTGSAMQRSTEDKDCGACSNTQSSQCLVHAHELTGSTTSSWAKPTNPS